MLSPESTSTESYVRRTACIPECEVRHANVLERGSLILRHAAT